MLIRFSNDLLNIMHSSILKQEEKTNIGRELNISEVMSSLKIIVPCAIFNISGNDPSLREMLIICLKCAIS